MSPTVPQDLFDARLKQEPSQTPLADRMRPRALDEMVGQDKILGNGRALRQLIEHGEIPSLILWGPPGSGKTTLAFVIARTLQAECESISAVMSGVKDLREVVERAHERRRLYRKRTILFIDEIHRFNKAQQDALLPHVERGTVTLVGATTENPSFELNAALLSRCRVFVLESLDETALVTVLQRALRDPQHGLLHRAVKADDEVLRTIARSSFGDARKALTTLEVATELAVQQSVNELTITHVDEAAQHKALLYDKAGEEHYNVISAFIKSLRGSDPDAAVYWLVRMLEAGEPPRFILRRMVIFASEDVGNADPRALEVATNALAAFEFVGLPEGVLPLTQAATYLACAPKSNAVIVAYREAREDVREHGPLAVPLKLRNAVTGLMKHLGYGREYKYPHNSDGNYVPETYLPDELLDRRYYRPTEHGDEKAIADRLDTWRRMRQR